MNPFNVAHQLLTLANDAGCKPSDPTTREENELAAQLFSIINSYTFGELNEYSTLDFDDYEEPVETHYSSVEDVEAVEDEDSDTVCDSQETMGSQETVGSNSSSYQPVSPAKKIKDYTFEEKERVVDFWILPESGRKKAVHHRQQFNHRSWLTMKKIFTWLTSQTMLYRFKSQVEEGRAYREKMANLSEKTIAEFERRRYEDRDLVNEDDLREIALDFAVALDIPSFKAS